MTLVAEKNLRLLNVLSFLDSFRTFDAVLAVYFSQVTGSYASAMFVLSLVNLSASFFEIPTGVFSDNIGRKKTMLFHYITGAIAILFYFVAHSTFLLSVGAIILGFAMAMSSGSIQAYVYENLGAIGIPENFKKYEGSRRSIEKTALLIAAIAGTVIIRYFDIRTALIITVLTRILAFVIGFQLSDVKAHSDISSNIYSQVKDAWKYFISNSVIKNVGIAKIISYGGGNVEFRFKSIFYKTLLPDWLVSTVGIFTSVVSAVVMKYTDALVKRFGYFKPLVIGDFLNRLFTSILVFIQSQFTPFIMTAVGSTAFGIRDIASEDILQDVYKPQQRATMGSLIGFASSLFYSILGVLVGFIADIIGAKYTLLLLQIFLMSSSYFFWLGLRHHKTCDLL